MSTIREPAREIPVVGDYDVVVAGGGPGGVTAAVAAARAGASTLLIERYGFLGGMATAGLVRPLLGVRARKSEEPIIGGIAEELCRGMADLGTAVPFEQGVARGRIDFEPEGFKCVCDRLAAEAGVELRLHSLVVGAMTKDGRLNALVLESKSGRQAVLGRVFVDATGDADLVAHAGARYTMGREADGRVQAMGNVFLVGGINEDEYPTGDELEAVADKTYEAIEQGRVRVYRWHEGHKGGPLTRGLRTFNITHVGGDPTDLDTLTRSEIQLRRDAWGFVSFLREEVRGMEDCYLIQTAPCIGVRESRQMVGLERVSGEDVIEARKRPDAVARCGFGLDIHCPMGRVEGRTFTCSIRCANDPPCPFYEEHSDELPKETRIRDGTWFDIPYGALVSAEVPNLLAAGRCVSADHQAMSALRVMGPCMAMGQAAGEAAAMAADADGNAQNVDVADLQRRLRANGTAVPPGPQK